MCEVEERTSGVTDTLLQEPDMTENVKKIITFAPGEGNKPLGIFMDKDSEFLSFPPTIYCGIKLNLIIRTEQHQFITVQYVSGNLEVKIED